MMRRLLAVILLLAPAAMAHAERADIGSFSLGGRAEYATRIDRDAVPFRWNDATHSLHDRTRLMVDLAAIDTRFGDLYLKGAALWDDTRRSDVQKRLRFEQGDYLWARGQEGNEYALRFFMNERRFFVEDNIAPLLDDDALAGNDNGGARLDAVWEGRLRATGLFSVVGDELSDARQMTYVGVRYAAGFANVGVSYLFNDMRKYAPRNHAVLKVETTAAYKLAYVTIAYQQSQLADGGAFFPGGRFDWDVYDGGNFAAALPDGGAFHAELRATDVDVAGRSRLKLTYRYGAAGSEFINTAGWNRASEVGHTFSAFLQANDVDLNGRLQYHSSERFDAESEERDVVEGSLWGAFRTGVWFVARGAVADIRNVDPDGDKNFLHLGAERRIKEMRAGVHVMWRDVGTLFSEQRYAVDGTFPLSANWGLYCRVVASRDFDVAQAAYARLDYRPSDRIFATFSYGRGDIGDTPFIIEGPDIDLAREGTAVYRVSIRGDF